MAGSDVGGAGGGGHDRTIPWHDERKRFYFDVVVAVRMFYVQQLHV